MQKSVLLWLPGWLLRCFWSLLCVIARVFWQGSCLLAWYCSSGFSFNLSFSVLTIFLLANLKRWDLEALFLTGDMLDCLSKTLIYFLITKNYSHNYGWAKDRILDIIEMKVWNRVVMISVFYLTVIVDKKTSLWRYYHGIWFNVFMGKNAICQVHLSFLLNVFSFFWPSSALKSQV